jgi:hypothetical protein
MHHSLTVPLQRGEPPAVPPEPALNGDIAIEHMSPRCTGRMAIENLQRALFGLLYGTSSPISLRHHNFFMYYYCLDIVALLQVLQHHCTNNWQSMWPFGVFVGKNNSSETASVTNRVCDAMFSGFSQPVCHQVRE